MSKAVILAGGSGTRLWPLSREAVPKQFLAFDEQGTLLQQTYHRLRLRLALEDVYVSTLERYRGAVQEQLPGLSPDHLIIEPCGRGTGPASAYVAAWIEQRCGDQTVATVASDAWIADSEAFAAALAVAFHAVDREPRAIAAVGVRPTRPATGFGYIQVGPAWRNDARIFEAVCFTEKPSAERAEELVASGCYLWNASYFVWRPRRLLQLFEHYEPAISQAISELAREGLVDPPGAHALERYARIPRISVDRAIMERARPMLVVPASMGWHDLGTWRSVFEVFGSATLGEMPRVGVGDGRLLVAGGTRLVATLGLDNIAVIDTPDALLVCSLDQAEAVAQVIDGIREMGKDNLV